MTGNASVDVSHYDGGDLEALSDMPNYTNALLKPMRSHLQGRVIEIGAGIGNISRYYIEGVDNALLVEPAANLHKLLSERFDGHTKATTTCARLEDVEPGLLTPPFDAAIMINVLEHIPDDQGTIERLYTLLKPGGALLLFVPWPWARVSERASYAGWSLFVPAP